MILRKFKRIIFGTITLAMFLILAPSIAFGIRQAPGTVPLEPAPVDAQPNYSGNIQYGEGATKAQQGVGPTYEDVMAQPGFDPGPSIVETIVGEESGDLSGAMVSLAIAIVFLSALITGAYYWYKTRKTK